MPSKEIGPRWLWQARLERAGKQYRGVTSWEGEGRKAPLSLVYLNLKPIPAPTIVLSLLPSLWDLPHYVITLLSPCPLLTHTRSPPVSPSSLACALPLLYCPGCSFSKSYLNASRQPSLSHQPIQSHIQLI